MKKFILLVLGVLIFVAIFYGITLGEENSITLTYESATRTIAEKKFDRKDDVKKIMQLIQESVPLEDSDQEIIKRAGGAFLVASIFDGTSRSNVTLFSGIPASIGYEVTIIRNGDFRTYSDVDTFNTLLDMIQQS